MSHLLDYDPSDVGAEGLGREDASVASSHDQLIEAQVGAVLRVIDVISEVC